MILSTKGRYAVMALVDIASLGNGRPVKLFAISERQGLDQGYLEQIFAKLKKTGLVNSVRGPGGGYILGRDSSEISVSDIMFSVEENINMTRCVKGSGEGCLHNKARCKTHHLWEDLGDHIYKFLRDISIADICNKNLTRDIEKVSNG